jgi:hypothetical protein
VKTTTIALALAAALTASLHAQQQDAMRDALIQIRDIIAAALQPAPTSVTIVVDAPGMPALLAALAEAQAQTVDATVMLPAGDYVGRLELGPFAGTHRVMITGEPETLPAPGVRIDPSYEGRLPRLVSADGLTPLRVTGSRYTLRGLQVVAPDPGRTHVEVGNPDATDALAQPTGVRLEQLLIRGSELTGGHRGVAMNGADVTVADSWCDRMWEVGADSQCFVAWNGPGPLRIVNNHTEASGENIMLGGSRALIGVPPSDVEIAGNTLTKDPAWRLADPRWATQSADGTWSSTRPSVKNLLEVKFARRVTITGNLLHTHWAHAQTGWAVLFTTKSNIGGPAPFAVIEDVLFEGNVVRDVSSGVNVAGVEGPLRRVTVRNNVWHRLDRAVWLGDGRFAMVQGSSAYPVEDVDVSHNTVIGNSGTAFMAMSGPLVRFRATHNTFEERSYGLHVSGVGMGTAGLEAAAPGYVFTDNAIVDSTARSIAYPPGNTLLPAGLDLGLSFDASYRLVPGSPAAGVATSDGAPLGADPELLPR